MQQMSPHGDQESRARSYEGYHFTDESYAHDAESGQKLVDDGDEQFADILVRKIKQELQDEMKAQGNDTSLGYRIALAIVSICALVGIFIALAIALSHSWATGGAAIALGWGTVAVSAAIIWINATFSKSAHKH